MPIFEFRCRDCGTKFERLVRTLETTGLFCPKCGGEKTEKVLSIFASYTTAPSGGGCPNAGPSCGSGGFS